MKRFIALMLCALCIFACVSCSDPLKEKGNRLDEVYGLMGDAYYYANYYAHLAGAIGNEETTEDGKKIETELHKQLDEWKSYLKDAKKVVNKWLDLTEEELDAYIAEWEAELVKIQEVVNTYKPAEETTEASETAA